MKVKHLTTDEIIHIYTLRKKGMAHKDIAKELNRSQWGVRLAISNVEGYLSGEKKANPHSKGNYIEATKKIKAMLQEKNVPVPVATNGKISNSNPSDPFTRLSEAEAILIDAVMQIAEERVKKTNEEKVAQIRQEYEGKLKHYQELLIAAQDSSMIGVLKKRFGMNP